MTAEDPAASSTPAPTPAPSVVAALDAAGVPYEVRTIGKVSSLVEAAAALGVEPAGIVKTLVVRRAEDDYLFVLVPGDRTISWPRLRALLGVQRMSMPDAAVAKTVTGYERGTITPFGSTTPWPVVADERVAGHVSLGSGTHGVGVTVDAATAVAALRAQVADVTDPA